MNRIARKEPLPITPISGDRALDGMKSKRAKFSQHYQTALLAHLKDGRKANLESASGLGRLALAAGVATLDLAKLHEQTLITEVLPDCPARRRAAVLKQAGRYFAAAITPTGDGDDLGGAKSTGAGHLEALMASLSHRTVDLAASNLKLNLEISQRRSVERALRAKERSHAKSLEKSARLQRQLRRLSRQLLSAQEDERKKISRELHDVIGQTLAGINIHLSNLKMAAAHEQKDFGRKITQTQRLVEKSADLVNNFARELRPAVLDDLGLIPALHSFMKTFTTETGVRTRLTTVAAVEGLTATRRTALFRVAQEALTNVARHAKATTVKVTIEKLSSAIRMTIEDDGKSFEVRSAFRRGGRKRLGLLGMRERIEMVGGRFQVESAPGKGTIITGTIPLRQSRKSSVESTPLAL